MKAISRARVQVRCGTTAVVVWLLDVCTGYRCAVVQSARVAHWLLSTTFPLVLPIVLIVKRCWCRRVVAVPLSA